MPGPKPGSTCYTSSAGNNEVAMMKALMGKSVKVFLDTVPCYCNERSFNFRGRYFKQT